MESPPKRMTRARAAAKASEPAVKTTKIITAAARAKTAASSSATAGTKSTAAKRKTRADEHDDESEEEEQEAIIRKATRGRPKKILDPQEAETAAVATKPGRGRPAKKTATELPKEEPAAAPKPRGRPRKTPVSEPEAIKATTRGRAATVTKPAASNTASKPTVRKTVKFEEPDKENIEPASKDKETTVGIRARPVRRGVAVTGARSAKNDAKSSNAEDKKPLSPKKVTQMPIPRDDDSSEDELAGNSFNPQSSLNKSPVKRPKQRDTAPAEQHTESAVIENSSGQDQPEQTASLGSPARRPLASPAKASIMSPAKRIGAVQLPGSTMKHSGNLAEQAGELSPSRSTTLLQSAPKRPLSPIKGLSFPSASKTQSGHGGSTAFKSTMFSSPAKRAMPGFMPLTDSRPQTLPEIGESPAIKPLVAATPTPVYNNRPSHKLMMEDRIDSGLDEFDSDEIFQDPIERPQFSGRLSSVMPRAADPSEGNDIGPAEEAPEDIQLMEELVEAVEFTETAQLEDMAPLGTPTPIAEEPATSIQENESDMALDEVVAEMEESTELPPRTAATPTAKTGDQEKAIFQLRQESLDDGDHYDSASESEDEVHPANKHAPTTPTPSGSRPKNRRSTMGLSRDSRRSTIGLTSLAEQFSAWSAASPVIAETEAEDIEATQADDDNQNADDVQQDENLAVGNEFFENEMVVHLDSAPQTEFENSSTPADDEVEMEDLMITDEDMALAQEANDMSLMEPHKVEEVTHSHSFEDDISEASQEYGDENEVPVDPAMTGSRLEPATPVRQFVHKPFNTTTKVPLKPADDSVPSPVKRSFSATRVAPKRPAGMPRSATVISYSPTKDKRRSSTSSRKSSASSAAPVTPSKSDMWSNMGTPARTPRRDLNPALLKGAVVFVDVHTSEGADASGIFIELLGQMGARCIKTWNWNPSSPNNRESSTKVGITHVVYKDGGKRTLEKVRETNGVVQCVGVSWVLDCERENQWLDEAPYYIDTALVPRGGARRRKSMEPQALANMNGTLVKTPSKGGLNTPIGRRQSTLWMHTPSDQGDQGEQGEDDDDLEWSKFILTPVPKTPAPEAIAKFAAELPETPSDCGSEGLDSSPTKEALLMQTCPPKSNKYSSIGEGMLREEKDEQVLMRLMAARRKSLQFAPKIGSPLARAWNH